MLRKGFTLIELVMVMTIVAVLSLSSIAAYTSYRKSSLVDLAADNVVSTLYKMRDEVALGKLRDGEDVCFGLYFEENVDEGGVSIVSSPFGTKKSFDGTSWIAAGCDMTGVELSSVELEDLVSVRETEPSGNYYIMFEPPYAEVKVFEWVNGEVDEVSVDGEKYDGKFVVFLQYGEGDSYKRKISIDINSKLANVEAY